MPPAPITPTRSDFPTIVLLCHPHEYAQNRQLSSVTRCLGSDYCAMCLEWTPLLLCPAADWPSVALRLDISGENSGGQTSAHQWCSSGAPGAASAMENASRDRHDSGTTTAPRLCTSDCRRLTRWRQLATGCFLAHRRRRRPRRDCRASPSRRRCRQPDRLRNKVE